ncbi:MAG: dipeptidase [Melioribacteraceae bacterium]|nr:dipeptidase [Melioribacteraceae bacterium]MCF8353066.1 dipeptidase [Melioribacteraceae bacterium]MCF8392788.1 dipeptidase [Melioribacteraceae bacterium]MCF8418319.1 dipeptidase [Melioribacteraceae bacterium]
MDKILNYVKENNNRYIEELKDFIRIPTISTSSDYKKDMNRGAKFVSEKLKEAGLKKVKIIKTEGHSLVYGEWLKAEGKPTVLIYGHYDVQPVDPLELWDSPPFEPVIKDGKIWARGANDNKGQVYVHIKSVEAYLQNIGSLPVNVKFLIEGEEEIGSSSLSAFLKNNHELLSCDAVLISDTSLYGEGIPTINYGLRGLCYMEIELTGPNRDLHSGSFGGSVANPINELAKLIAKLQRPDGKITIPNFYKDVKNPTKKEKDNFAKLKFSNRKYAKELNVKELYGEKGYSTLERLWTRPSLDCNGIIGGYTEKGAKTVLPSKAAAKISMRLVPDQDPKTIAREFSKYVKSIAPKSVKIEVREMHGGYPVVIPLENKYLKAAEKATSKAFGKKTVFTREGGSIPIVVEFVKQLNAPAILMGLGLDTDNIHSPNEHFSLKSFELGILSSIYFLNEASGL